MPAGVGGARPSGPAAPPPATTCRAAAFTPPRLPPGATDWVAGQPAGGRRDWGGEPRARPAPPPPSGLPSRAHPVERRQRVSRVMASGRRSERRPARALRNSAAALEGQSCPRWWFLPGPRTRGSGRRAGTGALRRRPLAPDPASGAASGGRARPPDAVVAARSEPPALLPRTGYYYRFLNCDSVDILGHSAANPETPNSTISREASTQSSSATTSQGYVLPEGKIMPNTVFVGGIDVRMDETEIRSFFARYGSVKEVKIITDRTGVSKGYGFVSFYNDVDVQKIVESQINFHGKKLKLGPAIRKQNLCAYHVQPRPLVFNPPPPPQFQSVWSNPNTETYMQPPTMMNPITQYVQAYPPYPSSPVQVITGYQLPVYNYQMPPQWPAGEQRSYVIPPAYTAVNYHCNEVDPGAEVLQSECSVHEATPSSGNGPQKKSVDRSIQTVVSCLFNPENRLRNSLVTQDDYFKDKRVHHFRRSRAVLKSV
uniref:deleted in azoospermia-like n=1 Tax=Nyctereutes procyonoides TaxID=34880 RepID=UPI002443F092|nr:deleted in azoospermia-like [Nyctereutes procyonoides]